MQQRIQEAGEVLLTESLQWVGPWEIGAFIRRIIGCGCNPFIENLLIFGQEDQLHFGLLHERP